MLRLRGIYQHRRELLDQLYEQGRISPGAHSDLLDSALRSLAILHGIGRLEQTKAHEVAQREVQRFTQCIFDFDSVVKVIKAFELTTAIH
jgi:predicted secreted Zn-dependent protease